MTRNFPFLGGLATAALTLMLGACNPALEAIPDAPDPEEIPPSDPYRIALSYSLNADQTENLLKNNRELHVFDLRNAEAYAAGRLPRAISLPWPSEGYNATIEALDRKEKVLAYGDMTSDQYGGFLRLRELGFLDTYWLAYGFPAWVDGGKGVVDGEGNPVPREVAEALAEAEKKAAEAAAGVAAESQ